MSSSHPQISKTIVINIQGHEDHDLDHAFGEVVRLVDDGCTSGHNANTSGSFQFNIFDIRKVRDNSDAWKVLDKLSRGELPEADQPAEFEDCPTIISIRTQLVEEILRQCGDNLWGECSQYSIEDWRYEIVSGSTVLGYWEWIISRATADDVKLATLCGKDIGSTVSTQNPVPLVVLVQRTTGRKFEMLESSVSNWVEHIPTDLAGDIAVSEQPGSIMGSVFGYWLGNRSVLDPDVQTAIHRHIADHDVVAIRYIKAEPADVHSAIKLQYSQILARR